MHVNICVCLGISEGGAWFITWKKLQIVKNFDYIVVFPPCFSSDRYSGVGSLHSQARVQHRKLSQKISNIINPGPPSTEQYTERDQGTKSVWENHPCSLSPFTALKQASLLPAYLTALQLFLYHLCCITIILSLIVIFQLWHKKTNKKVPVNIQQDCFLMDLESFSQNCICGMKLNMWNKLWHKIVRGTTAVLTNHKDWMSCSFIFILH